MPGNHRSGRKRKPIELHRLHGTFRRDRHGHGPKASQFEIDCEIDNDPLPALLACRDGTESKAADATDEAPADEFWFEPSDRQAKELYEIILKSDVGCAIQSTDSPALTVLCELFGLLNASVDAARKDPCDRNLRSAVTAYSAAFDRLASRFGMTPSDRDKLQIPTPPVAGKLDDGGSRIPKRKRG